MNCVNCGKEIKEDAVFCIHCGSKQDPLSAPADNPPAHEETSTGQEVKTVAEYPLKKQRLKILCIAGAAVVLLAVCFGVYSQPEAKMNRAIKAGNLELAWEIYDESLYGEELSNKSIELLKAAAERIKEDYIAETISYEEALDSLLYIDWFESEDVDEFAEEVREAVRTQYQINESLNTAAEYLQNEDYDGALSIYSNVLSTDPENAIATQGMEDATNAYRENILKTVREYVAQDEFDLAEKKLQAALENHFQGDEALETELDAVQEQRIDQMSEDIYTAAEGGDWDGAVGLLDTYQKQFPDEQKLTDIRSDIEKKMPITLKNLTTISSKSMKVIQGVVTDRYGNVYDGAVEFNTLNQGYALYSLSNNFTTFTGTAFVSKSEYTGYDFSLAIYVDEKLVYYKEHISEETAPITFSIDVTGGTTLRVSTDFEGLGQWNSCLQLADTSFVKASDSVNSVPEETQASAE